MLCTAQWAGPKRIVSAALDLEHPQLPTIDFVVISHNHYDHLDSGTVKRLHARSGDGLAWCAQPCALSPVWLGGSEGDSQGGTRRLL